MSGRTTDLVQREWAVGERERMTEFLTSVEALRDARDLWDSLPEEPKTPAEVQMERTTLDQMLELEDCVLTRALDPDLAKFLSCVLEQLNGIAEGQS